MSGLISGSSPPGWGRGPTLVLSSPPHTPGNIWGLTGSVRNAREIKAIWKEFGREKGCSLSSRRRAETSRGPPHGSLSDEPVGCPGALREVPRDLTTWTDNFSDELDV